MTSSETTAPEIANSPDIPGYEILSVLGKGGMGMVYKARQLKLNRIVAVKALSFSFFDELGLSEEDRAVIRQRFLREASALAQMSHENIVQVHDLAEDSAGAEYIVMEYVEGEDLGEALSQGARIPIPDAINIVADVAGALQHAHERGIIHRDIKPQNIMLTKRSKVKVADFGIASVRASGIATGDLTSQGAIGTPRYMSPEQFLDSSGVDHRTDIYSLAVVLYRLVCGQFPFEDSNPFSLAQRIREEPPPLPTSWRSDIHPDLERALLKGLEKKPENRYSTAAEFAKALGSIGRSAAMMDEMLAPARDIVADRPDASGGFDPTVAVPASRTEPDMDAQSAPDAPATPSGQRSEAEGLPAGLSETQMRRRKLNPTDLFNDSVQEKIRKITTAGVSEGMDLSISIDQALGAIDDIFAEGGDEFGDGSESPGGGGLEAATQAAPGLPASGGPGERTPFPDPSGTQSRRRSSPVAPTRALDEPSDHIPRFAPGASRPVPTPSIPFMEKTADMMEPLDRVWIPVHLQRRKRIIQACSILAFLGVVAAGGAWWYFGLESAQDRALRLFLEEKLAQAREALVEADPSDARTAELRLAIDSVEESRHLLDKDQILLAAEVIERVRGDLESTPPVTVTKKRVVSERTRKANERYEEGMDRYKVERFAEAREIFEHVERLKPGHADAKLMAELSRVGMDAQGAVTRAFEFSRQGGFEQAFTELESARQRLEEVRSETRYAKDPRVAQLIYDYSKDQGFMDNYSYAQAMNAYNAGNAKAALSEAARVSPAFARKIDLDKTRERIRQVRDFATQAADQGNAELAQAVLMIETDERNAYRAQMTQLIQQLGGRKRRADMERLIAQGKRMADAGDKEEALQAFAAARAIDKDNPEAVALHKETASDLFYRLDDMGTAQAEEQKRVLRLILDNSYPEDFASRQARRKLRELGE